MAKAATFTIENFINNWNAEFSDYQLAAEDLKKTHMVMGALFQIFDRLGVDRETVLMPPPEKNLNEHMPYYWDLIPVINLTRVINHLISVMPKMISTISVNHLLQPTPQLSHSLLLLPLNLVMFHEQRASYIQPYEEEVLNVTNMVKELEEKKNQLVDQLNNQAVEKVKRADRVRQMQLEIQQYEEELKAEEQLRDREKVELETITKENHVTEVLLDQKRATKEGLLAERERKRALRVYDAEDIQANVAQTTRSLQEDEDKLNSSQLILAQKENSLKILQQIKPNLDTANNLLHEINKLKDYEMGDLDFDSKEGELGMLSTEMSELQVQEAELAARRADASRSRQASQQKRQHERAQLESAKREEEEEDKKRREQTAKALQRTQEIKELTKKYDEQRRQALQSIDQIRQDYHNPSNNFGWLKFGPWSAHGNRFWLVNGKIWHTITQLGQQSKPMKGQRLAHY